MPATHGNALAGATAAALEAIEIQKLLDGDREHLAAGREVLFDARSHAFSTTRLTRNPACRFSHEASWDLCPTPDLPLGAALALAGDAHGAPRLRVPDEEFVSRLVCAQCGLERPLWRLRASLDAEALRCPSCGHARAVRGFDLVELVTRESVPAALLDRPLSELGLREQEVFAVDGGGMAPRHFVLGEHGPGGATPPKGRPVVTAGQGNIGSFFCALLPRMRGVGAVVLCDPGAYEASQLSRQDMERADSGRNKATVQAERLRRLRPELPVEAVEARVETLPMGALRGAIVVSCLDSLGARVRLARRAWWMGCPFVDAAVEGGESLLVRVNAYLPEDGAACVECAIDPDDYARLEQVSACDLGAQTEVAP